MADLAELGIKINYKESQPVVKSLQAIEKQAKKTEKASDALNKTDTKASTAAQKAYIKQAQQIEKIRQSYKEADIAAKAYWDGIRKSADRVETDLKKLQQQNIKTFDREDIRLYRKELGSAETQLRKLRGKIPDKEFNRLQHEISQSRRALDRHNLTTSTASKAMGKLKVAVLAAGTAMGAIGIARLIGRTISLTAEIQRNAKMSGVAVEAFQEITFATGKYQITTEATTDALKELNLRADEFIQTGAGPAAEAFERLGYSQDELNKKLKDAPALLQELIGRMQDLDKAAQIRIADELFGGQGGEQFVAMIQAGSAAFGDLREEAHKLGVVIDKDLIEESVKAKNSIDVLSKVLSANLQIAVAALAPLIADIAGDMSQWVGDNKEFIRTDIVGGIKKFSEVISKTAKGMAELAENSRKAYIYSTAIFNPARAGNLFLDQFKDEPIRNSVRIPFKDTRKEAKATEKTIEELSETIVKSPLFTKPDNITGILDPSMLKDSERLFDQTRTQVENLYTDLERLNELWAAGAIDKNLYFRSIEMLGEKYTASWKDAGKNAEKEIEKTAEKANSLWDEMLRGIQRNTSTMLNKKLENDLKDWTELDTDSTANNPDRGADLYRPDSFKDERGNRFTLQMQAA